MATISKDELEPADKWKKLGDGGFGAVFCVFWKTQKKHVAVKKLFKTDNFQEVEILKKLKHPNIVTFFGFVHEENTDLLILLELCELGSLKSFLEQHKDTPLPPGQRFDWMLEAALPIEYLRRFDIEHMDIKTDNYVINSNMVLKLTDFGLSQVLEGTKSCSSEAGSWRWMPPERFAPKPKLSPKFHIYALALVFWCLFTRSKPFAEYISEFAVADAVQKGVRPVIPSCCPTQIADLIEVCWHDDRSLRPDITTVILTLLQHKSSFAATSQEVSTQTTQRGVKTVPTQTQVQKFLNVSTQTKVLKQVDVTSQCDKCSTVIESSPVTLVTHATGRQSTSNRKTTSAHETNNNGQTLDAVSDVHRPTGRFLLNAEPDPDERSVLVEGIPYFTDDVGQVRDRLKEYFQKSSNGGGEVDKVIFPVGGAMTTAIVVFVTRNDAVSTIKYGNHQFEDEEFDVTSLPPCVTSHWKLTKQCSQCFNLIPRTSLNLRKEILFPEIPPDQSTDDIASSPGAASGEMTVIRLNREATKIDYSPRFTISKVKQLVFEYFKVPPEKQRLVYNGNEMKDVQPSNAEATLSTYNVKPGSTVHLMVLLYAVPTGLNKVIFELYWDYPSRGRDYLDASALMFSGQSYLEVVDYRHIGLSVGAIRHSGDVMNDQSRLGHHIINVELKRIPTNVTSIFFTLSAWNSPTISHFKTLSLKFYEESNPSKMLCEDRMQTGYRTAVVLCSLSRRGGQWFVDSNGTLSDGNARQYGPLIATIQGLIAKMGQ